MTVEQIHDDTRCCETTRPHVHLEERPDGSFEFRLGGVEWRGPSAEEVLAAVKQWFAEYDDKS